MKKELSLLVLLAFLLIGVAACSQPAAGTAPTEQEATENVSGELEEIEVKNIEYGTEEITLEGKKLEQLTVTGTDDTFYCNLEENLKLENDADDTPVLVCKDPVYDITYYVNYGRDNYIYAYRNGKTELAVEIPARDLFCKEGELYFIAETDGRHQFSGFAQGNILKYNPADGTVAVVLACSADRMIVYQDGIFYMQIGEMKQEGTWSSRSEEEFFFSFATGESSDSWPLGASRERQWKGYLLKIVEEIREMEYSESDPIMQELLALGYTIVGEGTGVVDTISLVDMQGNVKETLQNVKGISRNFWINGDSIYYVEQREGETETESRSVLRQYNKQTGTQGDIAVLDYPTNLAHDDMIFCNDVVYFSNGLRVDLSSGSQCLMLNADGTSAQPDEFYTDGENLFCVSGGKLWLFEEQPGTPMVTREFVAGVPLEMGTYVYRLREP